MTKQKIRLFATDLDGTLFARPAHLTQYAIDTLRMLRKKGTKVAICTGRHYERILNTFPQDTYDYIVSNNGQDTYFVKEDIHYSLPKLSATEIEKLLPLAEKYPVILMASCDDGFYTTGSKKNYVAVKAFQYAMKIRDYLRNVKIKRQEIDFDMNQLIHYNVIKVCFSGTAHTLQKLNKDIPQEQFTSSFVNTNWLEVQPEGVNKGYGLRRIMEKENFRPDEVCAIGDGENDLSMLQIAGVKVAMENAMPSVKRIATDHADNYLKEGCAKWIRSNLL